MTSEPSRTDEVRFETVDYEPRGARMSPREWETRAAETRDELADDGIPASELNEILRTFMFDGDGRTWCYDGEAWWVWADPEWTSGPPPESVTMQRFSLEFAVVPEQPPAIIDRPKPAYRATHVVPLAGLDAWLRPNPTAPPDAHLDAGLDVMVTEWRPDGWVHIRCSNEWAAWVDGRLLEPINTGNAT